jgi:hypothetical protein
MIVDNIHEALRQVREMKLRLLATERITGYSGRVRAVAGTFALLGAAVMSRSWFPETARAHLMGWCVVMVAAFIANYSALFYWYLFLSKEERDWRRLVPAADGLPPMVVGGVLSAVFILEGHYNTLFGTWMCLFGLTNLSSRRVLPKGSWPLGIYYIACGTACLFLPEVRFTNPWPMGIVFFVGELVGGYIFHIHRLPEWRVGHLLKKRRSPDDQ